MAELSGAVEYPRVRKASAWPERRRDELLHRISEQTIVVAPGVEITASRDPDDNRVLEAAIAGQADAIVTGDRDLLSLGEFEGIPIISPAQLLAMLELGP